MPILTPQQYVQARQAYCYDSPDCNFFINQTGHLKYTGNFVGIFSKNIPSQYIKGINLRQFEIICQQIFFDCYHANQSNTLKPDHVTNLKNISAAIVYWKMSSQGGRAPHKEENMRKKWDTCTINKLTEAYRNQKLSEFKIGGVRIPTATAFMRFLFPNDFGIMDSRVVGKHTQPRGITTLSIRSDGYINDTKDNTEKYYKEYIPFLRSEAKWLNDQGITFQDIDASGGIFNSSFRACDIEMALF